MSEILFNDNWQFMLLDNGSELSDALFASEWHDVEVPHDWLIGDTENLYKSGDGWYRKQFYINGLSDNDVYYLRFDGVYMNSTVYVNGIEAGGREYGYSCFSIDITKYLQEDNNEIYVRVRYEAPNSRWYSGAGIYRSVFLRQTDKCHILENGVYISPKYNGEKWLVTIETEASENIGVINHTVYSTEGKKVAFVSSEIKNNFSRAQFYAKNPELWDVNSPVCYKLVSEIVIDNEIKDKTENTFGFRSIEFNPDKGFILNGKVTKLKGVCMHHDLGALGAAMNKYALKRQLKILQSFGVNAIRTSHNMPARELIDLANEMGFLIVSEGFDMWELSKTEYDYARFFPEKYKEDVKSWVTRDRNAPCVIMWSIGNEILDTHKSERGLEVAKMLCNEVYAHDKYKNAYCTIGSNYMRWENAQKVADYIKLSGYNYTEDMYKLHHEQHPDWFIYGSETASTVRSRGIYHLPAEASILTHEDMQCSDMGNSVVGWGKNQEKALIEDRDMPFCGGQFVWTGFDYIGEPTPYSTKNSYFGIVDTAGLPKEAFYLYKAFWVSPEEEPFVHILPCWDFNIGQEITVYTYSNLKETELIFNGISLGRKSVDFEHGDKLHNEWKIPFKRGTLVATAYDESGEAVARDTLSSFGNAVKIDAIPDKYIMSADGRDLVFIEISALDINDNFVANARNRIKVSVSGSARLVGLDNGDSTDYDSYKGDNRRLFSGKLVAIIQATLKCGEITVTIEGKGLMTKEITLTSLSCEQEEGITVIDGYYPYKAKPYMPEIPTRKLELFTNTNILTADNPTTLISVKILPDNSDYKDIEYKCILANGIEVDLASLEKTENGVKVTAKGDGEYYIRALCRNGGEIPQVISDIAMKNEGLGSANLSPYRFISASLYSFSNTSLNTVERGAISGINDRTVIGFDNVDFGKVGSDKLILHCGHCGGNKPVMIEVWEGNPDENGRLIDTVAFDYNGGWDRFLPQKFRLSEKLIGIKSISFVVKDNIIFGGFEFKETNKAYQTLYASDNDGVYGDDFKTDGRRITDIGNNVVINYTQMNFSKGANRITICGRTSNDMNSVQIRHTDESGAQHTQLIEFLHSEEFTEQHFDIERIKGKCDISFVFMPGSKFDLEWFRFE